MVLRRYGLAAVVLPFLFGWLRMQGERSGWYGPELGVAILAVANAITFAILVWIGACSLRIAERREALVQESVRQAHLDLESKVLQRTSELATANAGLRESKFGNVLGLRTPTSRSWITPWMSSALLDAKGRFLQVSRACENMWGYPPEDLMGRPYLDMIHPDDREKSIAAAESVMSGKPENDFENRYQCRDGSMVSDALVRQLVADAPDHVLRGARRDRAQADGERASTEPRKPPKRPTGPRASSSPT